MSDLAVAGDFQPATVNLIVPGKSAVAVFHCQFICRRSVTSDRL